MKIQTVVLCCVLLLALPLFARDKTDVLVMNNGDRVHCEIKGLSSAILYVGFDYIKGTTSVDWSKVRYVESTQLFIVKMEDGRMHTGTLKSTEIGIGRPIEIRVPETPEEPAASEAVGQDDIVDLMQTSDRFWQRFNGSINSGLSYNKANQATQYNLSGTVEYPRERWSVGMDVNSTLTSNTGAPVSTRNTLDLSAIRMLRWDNWFYTGVGNFLQSSDQDIKLQSNITGGIGRFLKNTNRATISLVGGLAWQNTRYTHTADVQTPPANVGAGMFALRMNFFKFDKTNLAVAATVFPALSDPGRVYSILNATYYVKLFGKLNWNVSIYGNWDNRPPANVTGSSYGASSGLGLTFGNK
jgi:Protein of unknown function, DUF481